MKTLRWYRELCDRHFWSFVKICGGSVNQGADAIPEIHGVHCNNLQDDILNLRIGIGKPRDWRKSTIYTKWNACWRYLQDPEERQLFAAENERIGADLLYWVQKQFLYNKTMRELYHDILKHVTPTYRRQSRWSGTQCDMPRQGIYSEPSFRAIGVGGAAQSGHYTTIHIDDLVGKKAMESDLVMEGVFKWFDNVPELLYQPDPNSPDPSRVQIIGTHWAIGDFFDYVMTNYHEYTFFITPCLKDTKLENTEQRKWIQNPRVEHGESNWDKFPTEYYNEMKANPEKTMIFWSQHMNNPTKGSGLNKFDPLWPRWFYFEDIEIDGEPVKHVVCEDDEERIPVREIPLYGMIDPGGFTELKHTKRGARLALLIGGQPRRGIKKFIMYTWAGRFKDPNDFFDRFFDAHDEYSPRVWRMDNTTEKFMYRDLLLEKKERKKNYIAVHPLPKSSRKDDKNKDILELIVPMSNGEFYLHRSMKELFAEIKNFPSPFHKDLIDMMAKLYKTYLSRTPKKILADIQRQNREKVVRARQDCVFK